MEHNGVDVIDSNDSIRSIPPRLDLQTRSDAIARSQSSAVPAILRYDLIASSGSSQKRRTLRMVTTAAPGQLHPGERRSTDNHLPWQDRHYTHIHNPRLFRLYDPEFTIRARSLITRLTHHDVACHMPGTDHRCSPILQYIFITELTI